MAEDSEEDESGGDGNNNDHTTTATQRNTVYNGNDNPMNTKKVNREKTRTKRNKGEMQETETSDLEGTRGVAVKAEIMANNGKKGTTPPTQKTRHGTPETYGINDIIVTPASKNSGEQDLGGKSLQGDMNAEADSDLDHLYDETHYDDTKTPDDHGTTTNETAFDELETLLNQNNGKTTITSDDETSDTQDKNKTRTHVNVSSDEAETTDTKKVQFDISQNQVQTYITPPEIIRHKYNYRVQFSFVTTGQGTGTITQKIHKAAALHHAVKEFIRAGQTICSKLSINAWNEIHKLHTIQKPSDTPKDYDMLTRYVRCPPNTGIRQKGTNWYWGIHITCNTDMQHFLCFWDQQKPRTKQERARSVFQSIKPTPLQAPDWYEIGWLVGSGQYQNQQQNELDLAKLLQVPVVGLSWGNIYYEGSNKQWNKANQKFREHRDLDEKFRLSPLAAQVMVSEATAVGNCMKIMYNTYGRVGADGAWPSFPDGSRMRYTPKASTIKDIASKKSIQKRMALHIQMKYGNQTIQTNVIDPTMEMEALKGQTLQQVILGWVCTDEGYNEPYFRHFTKRWSWDPDVKQWDLSVHQHMYGVANVKARTMVEDLVQEYGESIRSAFTEAETQDTYATRASDTIIFDLDDTKDDMYMSGKTPFQFVGMPSDDNNSKRNTRTTPNRLVDTDDSIAFSETEKPTSAGHHANGGR